MIYLAGKITGEPLIACKAKFQEAEDIFTGMGIPTINPFKLGIPDTATLKEALPTCLKVIQENASAIFFLSDWKYSEGSIAEFKRIRELNRPFYFEEMNDYNFVQQEIDAGYLKIQRIPDKRSA